MKLPKAVEQAIYMLKCGPNYFAKCNKCKRKIDCFNFKTDYNGGAVIFKRIDIICLKCVV